MSITQNLESANMRQMIRERDEARRENETGVTVVIPCYEQAEYLPKSLQSVLDQTVTPLEILVIDDGSRQPLELDVIWVADGLDIRVIRVSNRGLPNARNVGLLNARGHAILPLDADDWLEPTFIEKTLPLLDAGADVVFTGLQEHGERTGTYRAGGRGGVQSLTLEQERYSNALFYCALIRTETLRNAGGYNGRMIHGYEDWDLWVDLMQRGARFDAVDEPLFNYRTRPDGMLAQTEADWKDWNWDEMARHHGYERPQPVTVRHKVLSRQEERSRQRAERQAAALAQREKRRQARG